MPNTLGGKIQKIRKQKGLTLEKLAELTGSSKKLYLGAREQKSSATVCGENSQNSRRA